MRNLTEVSIARMIVHILDGRPGGTTVLSDVPIDLAQSPVSAGYFQNQIVNASHDGAAGLAQLDAEYAPQVASLYQQIVAGSADFVSGSQALAGRLHRIMRNDQRIVPGDLVICAFMADDYGDAPLVALLKLNPTHAIVHHYRQDAQGRWIVTLEAVADALPTAGERLQKAALLRRSGDAEWELLVLDRQVGEPRRRPAADFFLRQFLGARWQLTPEAQTKRVFGVATAVAARLYKSDDPARWEEAANIYQYLDVALHGERIDLDDFVENVAVQEDTRQAIQQEFSRELVQRELEVHRATAETLTEKVRYRGDDGLMLIAPAEVYERLVREATIQEAGRSLHQITIKTRRWQRLRPRGR